jgi:hypothetical protein
MKADSPLLRTIELKDRSGRVVGSKEVVTYQGLLSKAHEEGLKKVATTLVQAPSPDNREVAIVRAEVETAKGLFQGYGDASPDNVNPLIVPHLIRMAETRAKARALRDAVNIGVVSFEELDGEGSGLGPSDPRSGAPAPDSGPPWAPRGASPARAAARAPARGNGSNGAMTESQRRYLFRLLAGQGLQGPAAHEYLVGHFGVESLEAVPKAAATALIDELLGASEKGGEGGGSTF